MSDPMNFDRMYLPMHRDLLPRITELIKLRTSHPALQRNEVEFFGLGSNGFHPTFDANDGERVFAYCRTNGATLGAGQQVIVVANPGPAEYPVFTIDWKWAAQQQLHEHGGKGQRLPTISGQRAEMELKAFQVRVFSTS